MNVCNSSLFFFSLLCKFSFVWACGIFFCTHVASLIVDPFGKQKMCNLLFRERKKMFRPSFFSRFYMHCGKMHVDVKLMSRDHKKSIKIDGALLDPSVPHTILPSWLMEELRSVSSAFLPSGYYTEKSTTVPHPNKSSVTVNAVLAGPIALYIVGQMTPCFENVLFVDPVQWGDMNPQEAKDNIDIRIGRDVINHSTFISELRPGGLLCDKPLSTLKSRGMACGLSESPWVARPWTRMKYMFIDELQRGPPLKEYIGPNPRDSLPWRFSQHCKYFRIGIWREITRRKEMHEGFHAHSSWQKSYQQSVPEMRPWAPSP